MVDDVDVRPLAEQLVETLARTGRSVATAESCTGGWVAKAITDVPGSSACFAYGIVSYSNGAKEQLLGVGNDTLQEYGAVSEAVVREMAEGARDLSGADLAVAVSGIAGPTGGSDEKPVGLVWFAFAGRRARTQSECRQFDGDRYEVRVQSVAHALRGLIDRCA